jgi:hypothetical protein
MQKQKRIINIWDFLIAIEAMFELKLPDASSLKPIKYDSCAVGKGWSSHLGCHMEDLDSSVAYR